MQFTTALLFGLISLFQLSCKVSGQSPVTDRELCDVFMKEGSPGADGILSKITGLISGKGLGGGNLLKGLGGGAGGGGLGNFGSLIGGGKRRKRQAGGLGSLIGGSGGGGLGGNLGGIGNKLIAKGVTNSLLKKFGGLLGGNKELDCTQTLSHMRDGSVATSANGLEGVFGKVKEPGMWVVGSNPSKAKMFKHFHPADINTNNRVSTIISLLGCYKKMDTQNNQLHSCAGKCMGLYTNDFMKDCDGNGILNNIRMGEVNKYSCERQARYYQCKMVKDGLKKNLCKLCETMKAAIADPDKMASCTCRAISKPNKGKVTKALKSCILSANLDLGSNGNSALGC